MNTSPQYIGGTRGSRAFTLLEMMGAVSIFALLVGAYMTAYIFIIRQDQVTMTLLDANDASRLNINLLMDEIRSCKNVQIGNGYYTNFVPITNGLQLGQELQLITSTNSGIAVYYWFDTNSMALYRAALANSLLLESNMVTQYLTNSTNLWITNASTFRAYDYTGTNLLNMDPTNYNYNYTVAVLLQFARYENNLSTASNYVWDYYQLTYRATRRCP